MSQSDSLFDIIHKTLQQDVAAALQKPLSEATEYAVKQLIPGLTKKYVGPSQVLECQLTEDEKEQISFSKFIAQNNFCREKNHSFYEDVKNDQLANEVLLLAKGHIDLLWSKYIEPRLSDSDILASIATGPGSAAGHESDLSWYSKMGSSNLSASSTGLYRYYKRIVKLHPSSYYVERHRESKYGSSDNCEVTPVLTSVEKNGEERRIIVKHPTVDMSLQLSVHNIITDACTRAGWIDITKQQPINRWLAYLGSLSSGFRTRAGVMNFCTADLVSASDFPDAFARALLPSTLYEFCHSIQSPLIKINDRLITKHMFSNMGCGFTFVLMTLLLTAVVKAIYDVHGIPEFSEALPPVGDVTTKTERVRLFAVFGDDIIVDNTVYDTLLSVLHTFGFQVNEKKSYRDGPFRESCGGDFYSGLNVRPVYCRDFDSDNSIYSYFNRLARWSAFHYVDLPLTLSALYKMAKRPLRVPLYEDDAAGFHVPHSERFQVSKVIRDHFASNGYYPYYVSVPKAHRVKLVKRQYIKLMWSWICDRTTQVRKIVSEDIPRKDVNPYSLLEGALNGHIRDGSYSIKNGEGLFEKTKFEIVLRISPCWDDVRILESRMPQGLGGVSHKRWETLVAIAIG